MDETRLQDALRTLEAHEIEAIERFVDRLRDEGWIRPHAADRWQKALERALQRRPLCHAQG
jgi:hypothetical protein